MAWQDHHPQASMAPLDLLARDLAREASHIHFGTLNDYGEAEIYNEDGYELFVPTHEWIAAQCPEEAFDAMFLHGTKLSEYPCLSVVIRSPNRDLPDSAILTDLKLSQKALMRLLEENGIEGSISLVSHTEDPENIARVGGSSVLQVVVPPSEYQKLYELSTQLQYEFSIASKAAPIISFKG